MFKFHLNKLGVGSIVFTFITKTSQTQIDHFLPIDSFLTNSFRPGANHELDSFWVEAFSETLDCLEEASLLQDSTSNEIYRFTFIRSHLDDFCIKLEKHQN